MTPSVLQRTAAITMWSRERGRQPSQVTEEGGSRYEYREIKVENGILQTIDPESEDIIKALIGGPSFDIEVGSQERPLYISDSGSRSGGSKIYRVEDRYNRIYYHAHVGDNDVKFVEDRNNNETCFSIY